MAKKTTMDFLKGFDKELEAMEGVGTTSTPPRYWYSTGNYVLNRIISGSYFKGIPQGRLTDFAGPAAAGKSFVAGNVLAAAQKEGAFCLVIDTENALDDEFMSKIGVDVGEENYKYVSAMTIPGVTKVMSSFLKGYKAQEGTGEDARQIMILIDSLDMLITETELEHYNSGVTKGDQGQRNRQLKAMLRTFVQAIKTLNVAIICTSQVYRNQDIMNGEGVWIISDAVRYAASQIVLIQKRKLKEKAAKGESGEVLGVRMICEGFKTRFTKPFQRVEIEVPYETGMDPYSGLIEVAVASNIVQKSGAWCVFNGEKFYAKDVAIVADEILKKLEAASGEFLETDADVDTSSSEPSTKQQRLAKLKGNKEE